MRALWPGSLDEIALIGAHCDDIAIGSGAGLLSLCGANPGMRVRALVLSGAGTEREAEERMALAALCQKAELDVTVLDLPDGRFPGCWEQAKEALEELRARCAPDLVFAPCRQDAHQDHRTVAELVPTAFRDHLTLGYEIPKSDPDLGQPETYLPVSAEILDRKLAVLHEHYPSQRQRDWFDEETFAGLARIRGVQCHHRYAEAYYTARLVLGAGAGLNAGAGTNAGADTATTEQGGS